MSNIDNIVIDKKLDVSSLENSSDGIQTIEVNSDNLIELATYLKISNKNQFDILLSVSGVDKKEFFEVVYHFFSTVFNKKLVVKVKLKNNNPELDSISSVYSAADWHERETYDLLGIKFNNHPDLERILLPKDWKGFPLRKDYVNDDERLSWNKR